MSLVLSTMPETWQVFTIPGRQEERPSFYLFIYLFDSHFNNKKWRLMGPRLESEPSLVCVPVFPGGTLSAGPFLAFPFPMVSGT